MDDRADHNSEIPHRDRPQQSSSDTTLEAAYDRAMESAARVLEEFLQEEFCRSPELAERLRARHAHLKSGGILPIALLGYGASSIRSSPIAGPVPSRPSEYVHLSDSELMRYLRGKPRIEVRYEVQRPLARGGMGQIVEARDRELDRPIALKCILSSEHSFASERFLREARITGSLEHPGIVPVHELGLDEKDRLTFSMRLVSGEDLGRIFDRLSDPNAGWTVARALEVVLKVCDTMSYAHEQGVVHRDLKPANIMVGRFGEVYVMDWGLAKGRCESDGQNYEGRFAEKSPSSLSNEQIVTAEGALAGTPCYMSPEQAHGENDRVGFHSDIYAVGAILYHLLTRRAPYAAVGLKGEQVSAPAIIERVRAGPPKSILEVSPDAPAELVSICNKAMAREISGRYSDMQALARDLRSYLEGRVVSAHEFGTMAELKKWVRRNKALAWTSSMVVLVTLIGLATTVLLQHRRLNDILLRDDGLRLPHLKSTVRDLGAALPENTTKMESWIAMATELTSRLPAHKQRLAELRLSSGKKNADGGWTFNDPKADGMHSELSGLVEGIRKLGDPTGTIGTIKNAEERLSLARCLERRTVDDLAPAWQQMATEVADSSQLPIYKGLRIAPQIGLVPIGRDPISGLHEFAHFASGSVPARGSDGRLLLSEESSLVFVLIPPGSFVMGAVPPAGAHPDGASNVDPLAASDEGPLRELSVDAFLISKYEMTQGQWLRTTRENPSYFHPGETMAGHPATLLNPVEQVSYNDCQEVLRILDLALPTELQWEYASRAGSSTPWWSGRDKASIQGCGNIADAYASRHSKQGGWKYELSIHDGHLGHARAGSFRANAFGLHDTMGNVWEWCQDVLAFYSDSNAVSKRASGTRLFVLRGGSYSSGTSDARSAARLAAPPAFVDRTVGVRPVRLIR
ncbi:MAG: SUMF1/EgtB/PvdO family nonheme iron enzyme [Planctomycetes bacterium]|nr:SUMF1/EgtB/PvdO family nonheme iron enzyme [Planctomycetota bacterium]